MTAVDETPTECTWPTTAAICGPIREATSLLNDFAELAETVELCVDNGVDKYGDRISPDRCHEWTAQRREVVEYIAAMFGQTTPPRADRSRVERNLREALDIITGSVHVGAVVPWTFTADDLDAAFGADGD